MEPFEVHISVILDPQLGALANTSPLQVLRFRLFQYELRAVVELFSSQLEERLVSLVLSVELILAARLGALYIPRLDISLLRYRVLN